MRFLHLPFALCALAVVACSGSVTVTGTGGGGSGGLGGTGGYVSGTAGFGGYSDGGAGGGGGTCVRTNDGFSYTLQSKGPNPKPLSCNGMDPGGSATVHLEGVVTGSTGPNAFTIDTCPPNADCDISSVYDLSASAPGLSFDLVTGAFVQIDVQVDFPWGCSNIILVRNLPVWGNTTSILGASAILLLEGSDGVQQTLAGSPFEATAWPLNCHPSTPMGCGQEDEYRFDLFTGGVNAAIVYQGETKAFNANLQGVDEFLLFRNLRSFETGWCDDYWNWAFWATPAPLPD